MRFPQLAVFAACLAFSGGAHAASYTVDFTANPETGAAITYAPSSPSLLSQATSVDFGSIFWTTQSVGGDTTGIAAGDTITFENALSLLPVLEIGSGNSGTTNMTLSWTTGKGTFVETLTSFDVNRFHAGNISFLNIDLFGTLTDPSNGTQAVATSVTLTQSGVTLAVGGGLSTGSALSAPGPLAGTGVFAGLTLLSFLLTERVRARRA